jgi:regulator of sirC expression with transglutaminase-like and TPR domain
MGALRDRFATLVSAGERMDLARGALEIARIAYPKLDPSPSLRQLDSLAATARRQVALDGPPEMAVAALATYLGDECGFRGNQDDYYDPRNSFLNDVLERRTGIPISLAVVLLETASRVGLSVEGVGFPGHFLVRVRGSTAPVYFDPFFGGRTIGSVELLARYRALSRDDTATLPADALAPTGTSGILARMLRNLLRLYLERRDHTHALAAVDLLLVLLPDSADELRVRGLLYEHLECSGAALDDLRRYLALAPGAPDAEAVRRRVAHLTRAAAAVH